MRTLVIVMNPREITECVDSFRALTYDLAWVRGYTLNELVPIVAEIVESTDYDVYFFASDDIIVTQGAFDTVLDLLCAGAPVAAGWCRLDRTHPMSNLTSEPVSDPPIGPHSYAWRSYDEVMAWPTDAIPTGFAGAQTGMSREMWMRFPFESGGLPIDYSLALRLRDANVPIVAAKGGFVDHIKERWNEPDRESRKRLRLGRPFQEVVIEENRTVCA